jgi:putative Ca2+/H+ antiporter (TMEM165/GDT1 family)
MLLFFKVLITEFITEMGGKTQLMLVALTSKYKLRDIMLGAESTLILPLLIAATVIFVGISVCYYRSQQSKTL